MNDVTIEDVECELRAQIEHQQALISVALGYIQSGRPDRAALVLSGKPAAFAEPQPEVWPCPHCSGEKEHSWNCFLNPRNLTKL